MYIQIYSLLLNHSLILQIITTNLIPVWINKIAMNTSCIRGVVDIITYKRYFKTALFFVLIKTLKLAFKTFNQEEKRHI